MATTRKGGRYVLAAGADLSSSQYFVVKITSNEVVLSAAATDNHLGVLQNAPEDGDSAEVLGRHASETGKVKLGGTVAEGDKLTADSAGKAIVTTTSGHQVFGIARAAGVSNDLIEYEPTRQLV